MKQRKPGIFRGRGGWVFLTLVLAIYAAVAMVSPASFRTAIAYFLPLLSQVIPILVLVFILMFVFNLFLDRRRIEKYFGRDSGLRGWLLALLSGAIASGPPYPWYALMGELKRKGMRTALITGFLYSRAIKLPLIPLMVHYFGTLYTALLAAYIMLFAVLNGLLMERLEHRFADNVSVKRP